MKALSEKIYDARKLMKFSRKELGQLVGVTERSIYAYEKMTVRPRPSVIRKLADVLQVSPLYLDNDDIDDPLYGIERKEYINEAAARLGEKAAKELNFLMERNTAVFAGGDIDQEEKDAFFDALANAYYDCKREAQRKYGRKRKPAAE